MKTAENYKLQKYRVSLVKDGRVQYAPHKYARSEYQAAECFLALTRDIPHEEVWVLFLNNAHEIHGAARISQGGAHGAALTPVELLRAVLASGCTNYILGHNHPSGDPEPSQADIDMTRLLIESSKTVGLTLLDHIIVTRSGLRASLRDGYGLEWD